MEWIRTQDRLPNIGVHILLYSPRFKFQIGRLSPTPGGSRKGLEWNIQGARSISKDDVTHWMPLPSRPESV